jgi:SNF2 family DNA or RNA helicase
MDETQAEVYDYIERNYMDYFISHGGNSDLHSILVRARLIRLMQVSTNPSLLEKSLDEYFIMEGYSNNTFIDDAEIINKIVNYKEFKVPKKFIKAGELIKNIIAKKEKVIVWATFIQNLHEFADYLKNIGIESRLLYGATPIESDEDEDVETREKIIRQFHRNDCPYKVLIANPFAISESISLHKACQNAIYLEKTFNAANFVQSKDRIHRVGLTNTVNYYYLLSDNNIDRTIHQRLLEKERRMLAIIENEPIPLFNRILDEDDDDLKTLIDNYVNHSN